MQTFGVWGVGTSELGWKCFGFLRRCRGVSTKILDIESYNAYLFCNGEHRYTIVHALCQWESTFPGSTCLHKQTIMPAEQMGASYCSICIPPHSPALDGSSVGIAIHRQGRAFKLKHSPILGNLMEIPQEVLLKTGNALNSMVSRKSHY